MKTKEFLNYLLKNRYLIINNKDSYNEVMFGQTVRVTDDSVELIWFSNDISVTTKGLVKYSFEEFEKTVEPFLSVNLNHEFKEAENIEFQKKLKNWFKVINNIYDSKQHRLELHDCIDLISISLDVSKDIASSVIKVNLAKNQFKYVKLKAAEYISLTNDVIELENKKRYLSSISDEIKSQSNRINYVVSHSQTLGNYREKLFISVLKKYIPKKFHIATGFIEGSSKQIDIIIYDQHNYIPIFREEDLVVVKKEAVIAVIEIKTTLDSNTLLDSLLGIEKITESGLNSVPFFKGIFAFHSEMSNTSIVNNISSFYDNNPINAIHEHLDVVCIPQKHCFFIDYNNLNTNEYSCPTLFEVEDRKGLYVGESLFFQKLFAFIEVENSAKKINRQYFEELNSTAFSKKRKILTESDWLPIYTFFSEFHSVKHLDLETEYDEILKINIQNVKDRVFDVKKWINGELSRDELMIKYHNP